MMKRGWIVLLIVAIVLISVIAVYFYPESEDGLDDEENDIEPQGPVDIKSVQRRITFDDNNHSYPVIHEDLLAWINTNYYGDKVGDIYVMNFINNDTRKLTGDGDNWMLDIYGDLIVWSKHSTDTGIVYSYSQNKIIKEINNSIRSIHDDSILYIEVNDHFYNKSTYVAVINFSFYIYNATTDEVRHILTKIINGSLYDIKLYGDLMLFCVNPRGYVYYLYSYDISTKEERLITQNLSDFDHFDIYGYNIVFSEKTKKKDPLTNDSKTIWNIVLYNYKNNTYRSIFDVPTRPFLFEDFVFCINGVYETSYWEFKLVDLISGKNYSIECSHCEYSSPARGKFHGNRIVYVSVDINPNRSYLVLIDFEIVNKF